MEASPGVINTQVSVQYEDIDLTEDMSGDLLSLTYVDKIGSESDELTISLKDDKQKWAYSWSPDRGAKIKASFKSNRSDFTLETGLMLIDRLELSCPPSVFNISAVAIPLSNPIRRKAKNRGFEKISFKDLAEQISKDNQLNFIFDCKDNPQYSRVDQKDESDLQFLNRLAKECGALVKIYDKTLSIFDMQSYESKEPFCLIDRNGGEVLSYNFSAQQSEFYKSCTIRFRDPKKKTVQKSDKQLALSKVAVLANDDKQESSTVGQKPANYDINLAPASKGSQEAKPEVVVYTYVDPNVGDNGQEFSFKKRCNSLAEAQRVCKNKLRELNLRQTTGNLNLIGNTTLQAGCVVALVGFGVFDGNFIIEEAHHNLSASGYITSLSLRRVNNKY